jgi:DNA polymerase-3 subunit beta
MKITLEKNIFLTALNQAGSIVERKHTMPILAHILLQTKDNTLIMSSTDLDISLVETFPVVVDEPGKVALPAHLLNEIVRKLPDQPVYLNKVNGQVVLDCGASKFNISCLSGDDFPAIGNGDSYPFKFTMKAWELRYLIDKTKFAMSLEETRYNLNGICLHVTESKGQVVLRAAATDSHRLACAQVQVPEGAESMPSIILSRKTVTELSKFLEKHEGDIQVALSGFQVCFKAGDSFMSSRLIDGTFPDYERLIPYDNQKIVLTDKHQFLEAVDRVSLISFDKMRPIKLNIHNNRIDISAPNSEFGSAKESVDATYESDLLDIGFNGRYLMDLTHMGEEGQIEMRLQDSATAALIQDVGDESSLTVLMPMRV